MPALLPVTSDGDRLVRVATASGEFQFRTHYTRGQHDGWLVDIHGPAGEPLVLGVRVAPGAANLLKGLGDAVNGAQLAAVALAGDETAPDALGANTRLVWFDKDEDNPRVVGDPLVDIDPDDWGFGAGGGA